LVKAAYPYCATISSIYLNMEKGYISKLHMPNEIVYSLTLAGVPSDETDFFATLPVVINILYSQTVEC